ncbi:MAG: hypothetical protein HC945_00045 [Nitrosarchaeum sp.]|nr:hypothetical protein [Nitrosarchaeum sp.]
MKKLKIYVAGSIGILCLLIFGIIAINQGWNLSGQILGSIGIFFGLLGGGCFLKPEIFGPILNQIFENIAKNSGDTYSQKQHHTKNSNQVQTKNGRVNITQNFYGDKDNEKSGKKKSEFIETAEGIALGIIIILSIVYILTYFGIIFRRGIILYLILFTIGPWLLILSVITYVISKIIGWQQEEKHEKSLMLILFVIGILIYLSTTGLMNKGMDFAKSLTYTPNELFGDQTTHENPLLSNVEKCSDDATKCNGVCYSKCDSGTFKCLAKGPVCEGMFKNGQYLTYTDQNYCQDNYWPDCGAGRKFVCDSIQGGICDHDPLRCDEVGKHSCKGTCWEGCPGGSQFICDDVKGGVCKQY